MDILAVVIRIERRFFPEHVDNVEGFSDPPVIDIKFGDGAMLLAHRYGVRHREATPM
jgi:hypothetical protein